MYQVHTWARDLRYVGGLQYKGKGQARRPTTLGELPLIMDFNRFTEKLQEAVRAAQGIAVRHSHQQVDVEHVLAALLEQEGGLAGSILTRAGVDPVTLKR